MTGKVKTNKTGLYPGNWLSADAAASELTPDFSWESLSGGLYSVLTHVNRTILKGYRKLKMEMLHFINRRKFLLFLPLLMLLLFFSVFMLFTEEKLLSLIVEMFY